MNSPRLRMATSEDVGKVLTLIASLSEDGFKRLLGAIRGPDGFDQSRKRCEKLAEEVGGVDGQSALLLITLIHFLYRRRRDWVKNEEDLALLIADVIDSGELSPDVDTGVVAGRLAKMLVPIDRIEVAHKLSYLESGLLNNATSFSTFLDLRPDFNADRSEFLRLVPVILFRATLESDTEEEKSVVFQLSESGLQTLRAAIEDAQKKIDLIKSDDRLQKLVVTNLTEPQ